MTESSKKLAILIAKIGLVVASTIIILKVSGELFARYTPWQKYMDPRQCLLWDGHSNGSNYVMIGDSEFGSFYVDSPDKTIWQRFKFHSWQNIFPGSLSGSKPLDMMKAAKLISYSWPKGTTVFIDVIPTRFLYFRMDEPDEGNYDYHFRRLIPPGDFKNNPLKFAKDAANYLIGKVSFLLWNDTALKNFIDGMFDTPIYYKTNEHFNRLWNRDGDFARKRFKKFEQYVVIDKGLKSFNWTLQLHRELAQKGLRAVFVITPLNKELVRSYSILNPADSLINYFDQAHRELVNFMNSSGMNSIDLYNSVGGGDFADMVHTNEHGDEIIAQAMAKEIKEFIIPDKVQQQSVH
jgi:hypothetical protein